MQLEELVGLHQFSGADFTTEKFDNIDHYGPDSAVHFNFVLDGITYTAIEDASDGYRSSMSDIKVSDYKLLNTFPPIEVMCSMASHPEHAMYVLNGHDVKNGKLVFQVGTDYSDDYYPVYIATFSPENMSANDGR